MKKIAANIRSNLQGPALQNAFDVDTQQDVGRMSVALSNAGRQRLVQVKRDGIEQHLRVSPEFGAKRGPLWARGLGRVCSGDLAAQRQQYPDEE